MAWYLTGTHNGWLPDDPAFRFEEHRSPHPHLDAVGVSFDDHSLVTELPPGPMEFQILENGVWERALGRHPRSAPNAPPPVLRSAHGLDSWLLTSARGFDCRIEYPGGRMRWDLDPAAATVCLHAELSREPSVRAARWRTFDDGHRIEVDTFVALPWGFRARDAYRYPVCIMMDGCDHIVGDGFGVTAQPERMFARALDTLARHGVASPVVCIGVSVPRLTLSDGVERAPRARAYFDHDDPVHLALTELVVNRILPAASDEFSLSMRPRDRCLVGHSNGADCAISMLLRHPDTFGALVGLSPGRGHLVVGLSDLAASRRRRLRVAMAYAGQDETGTHYTVGTARARRSLADLGVPHVVTTCPRATHSPDTWDDVLPGLFSFAIPATTAPD